MYSKISFSSAQIANFHNTIGDQMIPSQRPMMLEAALALSGLVQEQTTITWSNTQQLDTYIAKLKAATQRLAKENKQLAQCHLMIKERVGYWITLTFEAFFLTDANINC